MKTISVINQKGGIGKTMIATNLAFEFSKRYKTLIIDLDHQANTTSLYAPENTKVLLEDVIANKDVRFNKCIYNAQINCKPVKTLDIIPTSHRLANKTAELISKMYRETILKSKLDKIKSNYDICLIDCTTTSSIYSTNAIYASQYFIVPFTYGRYSLEGLQGFLQRLEEVKQNQKSKCFFVTNFFNKRATVTNKTIESEIEIFKKHICKTVICRSELFNQADITSQPICMFAKSSDAAKQIAKLTKEITNGIKK